MADNSNKNRDKDDVQMGSNRSFGIVFAIVFLIIALWPLMGDGDIRLWSAAISAAFLAIAFIAPKILQPLNVLWFKFGLILHKIVSPIMMGLVYVLTVLPIGLILRILNKNSLHLKRQDDIESYWINRETPGPNAESFKNQF